MPVHPSIAASFIPLAAGEKLTDEQLTALFPGAAAALQDIIQTVMKESVSK